MIMIMFAFLMINFMFFSWMMLMNFLLEKKIMVLEWLIYSYNSMDFNFSIYLDYLSMMFIFVVSLISFVILLYSMEYMKGDIFLNRFVFLLFLFVMSMFFMILSPSILSILFGWDWLGLISYCLIIYYQNDKAYKSGMLTMFINRMGDIGILLLICLCSKFGSWMMMNYNFDFLMLMLLMLVAFTKSAQMPFSFWLPMAMMAPTPISALVHSSTLVTAGVYLLIRYNKFLFLNNFNEYIFLISSFTMFMAGMIANFEFDFKKIIALSTLSQLGLMISILSIGMWELSFFHLLIHALFKSMMFLCVGSFIHYYHNEQDIRCYGGSINIYPFSSLMLLISIICLMGFPFLSGYYSKDLIMEMFFFSKLNKLSLMFLVFSTSLTVSYSLRMIMYIIFSYKNYNSVLMIKESNLMMFCIMILLMMNIFLGKFMFYLFYWMEYIFLSLIQKMIVLKLLLLGMLMGIYFYYFDFSMSKMNYWGLFFSSMFFSKNLYKLYKYPMLLIMLYEIHFEKNMYEMKIKFINFFYKLFVSDLVKLKVYNILMFKYFILLMMLVWIYLNSL
uniref:NADH-ubiquinone oxidoreductase chain 5 n=1 Tax=Megachile strupigera TaxID=1735309 RepID=A0A0P0IWP5_9HYME|nr:NADH dehydrogenase subunit 5 [Megachile strupigera]